MREIKINIPETIDLDDQEAKLLFASRLFELGKITLGQAASLAGLSKSSFMEILANYGVSVLNHPASEIENDLNNARNYSL